MINIINNEIHLFILDSKDKNEFDTNQLNILSNDEILRADKFVNQIDRNNYLFRHIKLREILSRFIEIDPNKIEFSYNIYKKPFILNTQKPKNIKFNISNSGTKVVIGVSNMVEIGVDIENIKFIDNFESVADIHFSLNEINLLNKYKGEEKLILFFKIWCAKESFIKAIGTGVYFPLKDFSVNLNSNENINLNKENLLEYLELNPNMKEIVQNKWKLKEIKLYDDYIIFISLHQIRPKIIIYEE